MPRAQENEEERALPERAWSSDCSGLSALGSAGKHYREEQSDYGSDYAAGNRNGIEGRDASSGEQKAEIGYGRDPENCA